MLVGFIVLAFLVTLSVSVSLGIGFLIHYLIPDISLESGLIAGAICWGLGLLFMTKVSEIETFRAGFHDADDRDIEL